MTIRLDHTITKVRKDGVTVASDTLEEGETLLSGETYAEAAERLKEQGYTIGIAFENTEYAEASDALTLDETFTNTVSQHDKDNPVEVGGYSEDTAEVIGVLNVESNGTAVIPNPELEDSSDSSDDESAEESESNDDDESSETLEVAAPLQSADKQTWYDWAKEHKGLNEDYDDITKNEIIEQYGS